jgi:hypothetical protein
VERLRKDLARGGVDGAVLFAFPEDIYRLADSAESRRAANRYVLDACSTGKHLYPFYFVWNDYLIPDDLDRYAGVKWHRHPGESAYDYTDPRCSEFLHLIKEHRLPVLLEEEFAPTVRFIERNPELDVIIPHMGERNGGTFRMKAFFDQPRISFDTSTASQFEIGWLLDVVGVQRVIFGTDVSGTLPPFFNYPWVELQKLEGLGLRPSEKALLYGGNLMSILKKVRRRIRSGKGVPVALRGQGALLNGVKINMRTALRRRKRITVGSRVCYHAANR